MAGERRGGVVLDSSFLLAWHNSADVHHGAAARAMVDLRAGRWGTPILLEYVFLEVVTVLLLRRGLDTARSVGDTLLAAADTDFVPCSDVFLETFAAFRAQPDATLSFVDAAIAVVARRHSAAVATFDRGLRAVPGVVAVPG